MNRKNNPNRNNMPIGKKILGLNLLLLIFAGIFDRFFYIKFLRQNSYDFRDVFVPWKLLIEYHSSGIGLFMAIVMAVLIVILVMVLWRPFLNQKISHNIHTSDR